jgi:hypothetical protein
MSDSERGKPASFDPRSGEVHGSGADAGGGGQGREDYDQDSASGSGQEPPHGARPIDQAAQRPIDPDEGK